VSPDVPGRDGARILTMNRGSSSLKTAIYRAAADEKLELSIQVDRADSSGGHVTITDAGGKSLLDTAVGHGDSDAPLNIVFDWLEKQGYLGNMAAAGHRIVHGGTRFTEPQRVTPDFLAELETLVPLDPDHLPEAIAGIRFISQKLPELPQIACFDTAFHSGLPTVARMYAIPRRLYEEGIRRYGFHGLSYEYVLQQLRAMDGGLAEGRVIIAHLGNGASMVALRGGKSVDTSMGFTPLEGLVMGTRSGDVDPGALIYLLQQGKMSPGELGEHLNKRSGLLGVSGSSEDMRDLLEKSPRRCSRGGSCRAVLLSRQEIYRGLRSGPWRTRSARFHRRHRRTRRPRARQDLRRPGISRHSTRPSTQPLQCTAHFAHGRRSEGARDRNQ
jgi:acetate kinase